MSKYSLDFDPGSDDRLPEWLVCRFLSGNEKGSISKVVFHSTSKEEAECMYEEYLISEQGEELALFTNQESEFNYV